MLTTSRFPHDAALRYAREPDFRAFSSRLEIVGPLELANVRPGDANNALREQDTARLRAALQEYAPSRLVEDSEIYAAGAAKFWADVRSAALSPQKKSPPTPAGEARGDAGIRARAQSGGKRRAHDGGRE